jgi:hypothetical protein
MNPNLKNILWKCRNTLERLDWVTKECSEDLGLLAETYKYYGDFKSEERLKELIQEIFKIRDESEIKA